MAGVERSGGEPGAQVRPQSPPPFQYVGALDAFPWTCGNEHCQRPLFDPVSAACCTSYMCRKCIEVGRPCPVCSATVPSVVSVANPRCLTQLDQLEVRCPSSCGQLMSRKKFIHHYPACPRPCPKCGAESTTLSPATQLSHEQTECPMVDIVCDKCNMAMKRGMLKMHIKEDCPVLCRFGCNEKIAPLKQKAHEEAVCPEVSVKCPKCDAQFKRKDTDVHDRNDCPVGCPLGCGMKVPPIKQDQHASTSCAAFLVPCTGMVVGCQWKGPRGQLAQHTVSCAFELQRPILLRLASLENTLLSSLSLMDRHLSSSCVLHEPVLNEEKGYSSTITGVQPGCTSEAQAIVCPTAHPLDWSGKQLSNSTFSGKNLSGFLMCNASLVNADLSGANLSHVNFSKANMRGAILDGADLTSANMAGATLHESSLRGANFHLTILPAALIRTDMTLCNLTHAVIPQAFELSGSILNSTKLPRELPGVNFSNCKLAGFDFSGFLLKGANFLGADLSGTKFSGSILSGANLQGSNLRNCDLSDSKLDSTNLSCSDLGYADCSNADLSGSDLTGVYLCSTNFTNVKLDRFHLAPTATKWERAWDLAADFCDDDATVTNRRPKTVDTDNRRCCAWCSGYVSCEGWKTL
ncbi:pentapeptide repeat family protein [Pelomyxa schiedti]|nr:pentapeptide repeat family protein [Pelomyxa schiedti]